MRKILAFLITCFIMIYLFGTYNILGSKHIFPPLPLPKITTEHFSIVIAQATKWVSSAKETDNLGLSKPAELPIINGSTPTGEKIPHQFKDKFGKFVMVVTKGSVYEAPTKQSEQLGAIKVSQRVKPLVIQKGWVFITDEEGNTPLGWTPKSNLAFKDNFSSVKYWDVPRFSFCKGEYCAQYEVDYLVAIYTNNWRSKGGGLFMKGTKTGQLYSSQSLLWAKPKEYALQPQETFLVISESGELEHELKYKEQPIDQEIKE